MTPQRSVPWVMLMTGVLVGATGLGMIGWKLNMQATEGRISEKRAGLKKLVLSGSIPPNQEVMDYLTDRQHALDARYQQWLKMVSVAPVIDTGGADLQLYFQEQFHDVQRTLERLALARSFTVPELLGFPKDLPPSDTVPRLLVQLALIRETATVMLEQGMKALQSFKIEDPETVPAEEGDSVFLTRLPVRVRLRSSLPQLMKMLGAIERATPLIDLRAIRILPTTSDSAATSRPAPAPSETSDSSLLEVELVLARYLATESLALENSKRVAPQGVSADSRPARTPREHERALPLQP